MKAEHLEALAADFWARAGQPAGFPRDLERAIPLAVSVGIVRLDGLRPIRVHRWLLRHGLRLPLNVTDRPLDGCIVAYRGRGVIFLAAGLDAAQERVILAHELGHYLADYESPRRRALRRLGASVLPILDGQRQPSPGEDLAGVLAGLTLGAHVHYMDRGFDLARLAAVDRAERTASELACELLAPRRAVLALAEAGSLPNSPDPWRQLLREQFGLSADWSQLYAARLFRQSRGRRTFTDLLGL
jgi:hypothetical protein